MSAFVSEADHGREKCRMSASRTGFELPALRSVATKQYEEPVQHRALHRSEATQAAAPTNFSEWTEQEINSFLDQRGEDYDDCIDFYALVARAAECEHNTGPATKPTAASAADAAEVEEDDPLDAFMAGNAETVASDAHKPARHQAAEVLDTEDAMADYIDAHEAHKQQRQQQQLVQSTAAAPIDTSGYGSDEEVYAVAQALEADSGQQEGPLRKNVEPLPPVDHKQIAYKPFKRSFYDEHPELFVLEDTEVAEQRRQLQVRVTGADVPKPVSTFAHCGLPKQLEAVVAEQGFTAPTAIQAQVLPVRCFEWLARRLR